MEASKVASGSVYLTLQNVLSTLIGIVGIAFLTRAVTQQEMGILAAITLIGSLINLAADFGLSTALPKHVSELKGKGEDISTHIASTLLFKTPAAALISAIFLLFSAQISQALFNTTMHYELIKLAAIDGLILAMNPLFSSTLLGIGDFKKLSICGVASISTRWIAVLAFIWTGHGFNGAVMGWIIGDLIGLITFIIASLNLIIFRDNILQRNLKLIPDLLRFSWPLFAASIITFLYTWYDRAVALALLPTEAVGIYDVSFKAFSVLGGIAGALGTALFPYYGMAYGRKDHKTIEAGIKTASRYLMIIIFPLTLGLLSTAKPVITIFAGEQYEAGWSILFILSLFGLTYGLTPAIQGLLLIYEKTKTVMILSFTSVALSLVLLPFIGVLDLNGLAFMRGISLLLSLGLNLYFLSKIIKIEIDTMVLIKTLSASIVMAITVLIVQQFNYSKFLFPAYILIGAVVYLAGIIMLKVPNEGDMNLVKQIIGQKVTKIIARIIGYKLSDKEVDKPRTATRAEK